MTNTARKLDTAATLLDVSGNAATTEAIRKEARRLLETGEVAAVIGYAAGRRTNTAAPVIVTKPEDTDKLIFSAACVNNLSLYLSKAKKEVTAKGKVAVVLKGCDLRAFAALLSENQLKRDQVHVIGVACPGVYGGKADKSLPLSEETVAKKCRECTVHTPQGADFVAGSLPALPEFTPEEAEELARLEAMTPAERWAFWKEHFSRCVRCMACRSICPLCFCEQCLCDRGRPQAVENSPRPSGNMAWHIVRAMHLAGRCGGCAECERVCPMDIPLNLLNRKMAQELKELYGYEAGMEPKEKGPLNSFDEKDDQSFIK